MVKQAEDEIKPIKISIGSQFGGIFLQGYDVLPFGHQGRKCCYYESWDTDGEQVNCEYYGVLDHSPEALIFPMIQKLVCSALEELKHEITQGAHHRHNVE